MATVTNEIKWVPVAGSDPAVQKAYVGETTNEAFTLTTGATGTFLLASEITLEELKTSGTFATEAAAKDFAKKMVEKYDIFSGTIYDGMPADEIKDTEKDVPEE